MTSESKANDPIQTSTLRLIIALSFLTGGSTIGQPFGEGTGLEAACSIVRNLFDGINGVRSGGFRLAISFIAENSIGPDDVNAVMGIDMIDRSGLTADQAEAARSLGGAAVSFLGQVNQEGASMWELWKKNDGVAEEFLCWYAVAWGRLATLGKVPRDH